MIRRIFRSAGSGVVVSTPTPSSPVPLSPVPTVTVADAAGLATELGRATPGTTVIGLQPGNYGDVGIYSMAFASDVWITSTNPASPAVLRSLDMRDSAHVRMDRLNFTFTSVANPYDPCCHVRNSSHITLQNSEVVGDSGHTYWYGYLVQIEDTSNFTGQFNYIHHGQKGYDLNRVTDATVTNNRIEYMAQQGHIKALECQRITLSFNGMAYLEIPDTNSHCEFIQIYNSGAATANADITVTGNLGYEGTLNVSYMSEPITCTDNMSNTLRSQRITFTNNTVYCAAYQAITILNADGIVFTGNRCFFIDRGGSFPNTADCAITGCSGTEGGNADYTNDLSHYDISSIGGMTHGTANSALAASNATAALAAYAAFKVANYLP